MVRVNEELNSFTCHKWNEP